MPVKQKPGLLPLDNDIPGFYYNMSGKPGDANSGATTEWTSREGKKAPQYIAALSVCLGAVGTGAVLGWTANISTELKNAKLNDIEIDDDSLGWIGSFVALGAMVMCFPTGKVCDVLGRKTTMLFLTIPFVIGWLIIIFASNIQMIFLGRFITGMAGGAFCVSAPLYTSEIAEKEIRGTLGSYFQLLFTVGILAAYISGLCMEPKGVTIFLSIIPIVFAIAFSFQPETPVYRLKQGRDQEAREILIRLRGDSYDVDAEVREIKRALQEDERNKVPLMMSLKKRATKKAALIGFGLMFFQQASGVNAVIFYTSTIFESAGSQMDPKVATIIVGVMQVVATFISSLVIDRLGRRILLLCSDIGMVIAGVCLGLFFSLQERHLVNADTVESLGFLPVLSLCVFIVTFSLGFGPIPWMISAEVFPAEVKSIASSTAATFNWFICFLITKFYINMKNAVGGDVTFYIFAAISVLGTLFIFSIVPETKGKTLDEIQMELSGETRNRSTSGVENQAYNPS